MKKYKSFFLIGLFLVSLFCIVLSFIPFQGTKYSYLDVSRLKINALIKTSFYDGIDPLRSDIPKGIKSLDVPNIELIYKKKTKKYFKELWAGYEKGSNSVTYSKEGVDYYSKNRAWKKAKLIEGTDTFKVYIRSHGIQPDGHHEGDFFSYQVKVRKGKKFRGNNKFKLLIYERIGFQADLLSYCSQKYSLFWAKPEELIKLKINGKQNKLYYLEKYGVKIPKGYTEVERLSIKGYKSGAEVLSTPGEWMKTAIDSSSHDSLRKYDLKQFNGLLTSRDSVRILSYFDQDYLIRFLVLKSIFGYSGHECYPGNWYMYYSSDQRKFYPALSREPSWVKLDEKKKLKTNLIYYNHPVEDRSHLELNLYSVLFANKNFYNDFIDQLEKTLIQDKSDLVANWDITKEQHERLVQGNPVMSLFDVKMKLEDIESNINILEKLLRERGGR